MTKPVDTSKPQTGVTNSGTDPATGPVAVPTTDQAKGTFPKDAEDLQKREDERKKMAGEK